MVGAADILVPPRGKGGCLFLEGGYYGESQRGEFP